MPTTQELTGAGYALLAIAVLWVLAMLARYWREQDQRSHTETYVPLPWWRTGTLTLRHEVVVVVEEGTSVTLHHTHALDAQVLPQLGVHIEETVAQLGPILSAAVLEHQRRALESVPPSRQTQMPPEPEERIAHDMRKAHAIARGAQQLQAEATSRGMSIPLDDAMAQAAQMLGQAYDHNGR